MSISIRNLSKSFAGKPAVDDVSVEIESGTFFVVLGASGCGKSTLLKLIAGLEEADSGAITLHGETVTDRRHHLAPEARNVGMVFQSYALWPHMTVERNVAFPVESDGRAAAKEAAARHLATVALNGFEQRLPASLSGGQRQRVALARCLAQGARTVLMDEPLANLDPHLRATMEEELARFHVTSRATTIYITHDQREAMALAGRMAVMDAGRFLQVGTPQEIYERPADEIVARFIGRSTIVTVDCLETASSTATVHLAGHQIHAACMEKHAAGTARLVIRPEQVELNRRGVFSGTVTMASYRGGHYDGFLAAEGFDEAVPFATRERVQRGDSLAFDVVGGWLLPA